MTPNFTVRAFIHDMNNPDIYAPGRPRRKSRHEIRGVNYEVSLWGSAERPPFFWLHGWGDCSATFQFVVDRLQHEWFVVAPDFRGFGGSTTGQYSFWFPDYLADLDELLNIYSPGAPALIAGHSMGANVGGLFAGSLPERVRAFVNVEGFGLPDTDPSTAPLRYRRWIERGREPQAFASYVDYPSLARRVRQQNPRMTRERAEFVARCWAVETDGSIQLRANPRHKLPNPVLYRRGESEACWRNVEAPVLLVAGSDSRIASQAGVETQVAMDSLPFPDTRSVVIPDAGHMLHFDAPSRLAGRIEDFFRQFL